MEDFLIPSRIRSIRPAPKFWLTKVALALAMLARGMFPIMTILRAAVWAAMMEVPSVLMEPCRMTEPMEKMEFHQAHGKTGGDKLAHEFLIIGKMSSGRNQKTEIPVEIQKAEHTGDQLGQNGRSCDSGHTETEDGHGKKIQKKVKAAGEDQEIQRGSCCFPRLLKGRSHVIEEGRGPYPP